ncbi:SDR family NAD(P)-dependent oxidoreductase [Pleomorphovibrio marinus]|nr:SDR family NAD(P)-dependent oxidoreductase [Pleomorphovibrio marinus]
MDESIKTTVITGGSSGLGLAMAEKLGQLGYRVVLLARNPL